jgi:AcrR family transcriptional regulator
MARERTAAAGSDTRRAIEQTAVRLFYANGYHGTSIRDIAREADVGIATLFHHHGSKQELLVGIMDVGFDGLLTEMRQATYGVEDPAERLAAAVRVHVRRHCANAMESHIATTELRSLDPEARSGLDAKREQIHAILVAAVTDGVASGDFHCDRPRDTARALHGMCSAVGAWYREGAGMTPEEVAELYVALALRLVGGRELAPAGAA